jgi:ABC-2 type transport system permease protein
MPNPCCVCVISRPENALRDAVRRGDVTAGIIIPAGYDRAVARSHPLDVAVVGNTRASAFAAVRAAVTLVAERENAAISVARALAVRSRTSIAIELAHARVIANGNTIAVDRRTAHAATRAAGLGRVTAGMLVFFMFVVSMDYATELVKDRWRGVVTRMATTPTRDSYVVTGEMAGRLAICMIQAVVIVAAGALLFGIRWGNPIGVAAVLVLFALLSTSASVLVGCSVRLNETDAQFTTSGLTAGLGVVGGCFFSLALVPTWLRVIGHLSPHAWAVDALGRLGVTDAGIGSIAVPLLVLAAFTVVVFTLAVRQLSAAIRT